MEKPSYYCGIHYLDDYDPCYTYSDFVKDLRETLTDEEFDYLCGLSDEELEELGL